MKKTVKCKGLTKKDVKCTKKTLNSSGYCNIHIDQKPISTEKSSTKKESTMKSSENLIEKSIGEKLNLIPFKYEFKPDFSKYILIEENEDDDNIIYYDPDKKRFIKFLYSTIGQERYLQLKREIIIGNFLHTIDPKHFVNIVGYINFKCNDATQRYKKYNENAICEGVISEKINGISLKDFILKTDPEMFKIFIINLFELLLKINEKYSFVHADLHEGNIFVSPNNEPILLDFGQSYIKIPLKKFCKDYKKNSLCKLFNNTPNTLILGTTYFQNKIVNPYLISDFNIILNSLKELFYDLIEYRDLYSFLYSDLFHSKTSNDLIKSFDSSEEYKEYKEFKKIKKVKTIDKFIYYTTKYKNIILKFDILIKKNKDDSNIKPYWNQIQTCINKKDRIKVYQRMKKYCNKSMKLIYLSGKEVYTLYGKFDMYYYFSQENIDEIDIYNKIKNKVKKINLENFISDIKKIQI